MTAWPSGMRATGWVRPEGAGSDKGHPTETYPEWPQVVVVGFKEVPPVAYRVIEALGGEGLFHRANVGVVEEEERTHSEGGRVERRADDPLLCSFCGEQSLHGEAETYCSSRSSPTVGECSSVATFRTASSTPGMNDSRAVESWRRVSV